MIAIFSQRIDGIQNIRWKIIEKTVWCYIRKKQTRQFLFNIPPRQGLVFRRVIEIFLIFFRKEKLAKVGISKFCFDISHIKTRYIRILSIFEANAAYRHFRVKENFWKYGMGLVD